MSDATNTNLAIEARGLVKRFGKDVLAVDGDDGAAFDGSRRLLGGRSGGRGGALEHYVVAAVKRHSTLLVFSGCRPALKQNMEAGFRAVWGLSA